MARYYSLSSIPNSIKNLNQLEELMIESGTHSLKYLELPINDGEINTTLRKLSLSTSSKLIDDFVLPTNFMQFEAFEELNIAAGNRSSQAETDRIFLGFYDYFYSVLYNETDNSKNGFSISSLNFINGESSGFQHNNFRTLNYCKNGVAGNISISYQPLVTEINQTGFTFITYYNDNLSMYM